MATPQAQDSSLELLCPPAPAEQGLPPSYFLCAFQKGRALGTPQLGLSRLAPLTTQTTSQCQTWPQRLVGRASPRLNLSTPGLSWGTRQGDWPTDEEGPRTNGCRPLRLHFLPPIPTVTAEMAGRIPGRSVPRVMGLGLCYAPQHFGGSLGPARAASQAKEPTR